MLTLSLLLGLCSTAGPPLDVEASNSTIQVIIYFDTPCRPATSAYIELPGLHVGARADRHGRIELREVPPGSHRFLVWSTGHGLIETTVNVSAHVREIILLVDLERSLISRVSRPARGAGADLSSEKPDKPLPGGDA
jgi:hypothetical protein